MAGRPSMRPRLYQLVILAIVAIIHFAVFIAIHGAKSGVVLGLVYAVYYAILAGVLAFVVAVSTQGKQGWLKAYVLSLIVTIVGGLLSKIFDHFLANTQLPGVMA